MSVLLYDPDCGFCTASANLLRRLEPGARILPGTPENLVQYRVDARRFAHALPFINAADDSKAQLIGVFFYGFLHDIPPLNIAVDF